MAGWSIRRCRLRSYTKVTREDSDAIYAYLRSIPPVRQRNREHDLKFPFNNRSLILGWRTLFFTEGEFKSDPTKSADWNRGAYLVEGLGHCGMCHTAINALGGSSESQAFEGGLIPMQNWYAPSLTSNKEAGLGDWTIEEISDYLRKGVSTRGAVYGPMAEVVYNSLQYLNDGDTRAMAIYLKSLAQGTSPEKPSKPLPSAESSLLLSLGKQIYDRECASCHGAVDSACRRIIRCSPATSRSRWFSRQRDPDGAQWRLSAGHGGQSDALWHAAFCAPAVRRRGRSRRHIHPYVLGQSRRTRFGASSQ